MQRLELSQLVDLSIGTPEVGAVNFNALHTLLHALINHLKCGNIAVVIDKTQTNILSSGAVTLAQFSGVESTPTKDADDTETTSSSKGKASTKALLQTTPYHRLQQKVNKLDEAVTNVKQMLTASPTASEMIKDMEPDATSLTSRKPVQQLYQNIRLDKRVTANEDCIQKMATLLDDLMAKFNDMETEQETHKSFFEQSLAPQLISWQSLEAGLKGELDESATGRISGLSKLLDQGKESGGFLPPIQEKKPGQVSSPRQSDTDVAKYSMNEKTASDDRTTRSDKEKRDRTSGVDEKVLPVDDGLLSRPGGADKDKDTAKKDKKQKDDKDSRKKGADQKESKKIAGDKTPRKAADGKETRKGSPHDQTRADSTDIPSSQGNIVVMLKSLGNMAKEFEDVKNTVVDMQEAVDKTRSLQTKDESSDSIRFEEDEKEDIRDFLLKYEQTFDDLGEDPLEFINNLRDRVEEVEILVNESSVKDRVELIEDQLQKFIHVMLGDEPPEELQEILDSFTPGHSSAEETYPDDDNKQKHKKYKHTSGKRDDSPSKKRQDDAARAGGSRDHRKYEKGKDKDKRDYDSRPDKDTGRSRSRDSRRPVEKKDDRTEVEPQRYKKDDKVRDHKTKDGRREDTNNYDNAKDESHVYGGQRDTPKDADRPRSRDNRDTRDGKENKNRKVDKVRSAHDSDDDKQTEDEVDERKRKYNEFKKRKEERDRERERKREQRLGDEGRERRPRQPDVDRNRKKDRERTTPRRSDNKTDRPRSHRADNREYSRRREDDDEDGEEKDEVIDREHSGSKPGSPALSIPSSKGEKSSKSSSSGKGRVRIEHSFPYTPEEDKPRPRRPKSQDRYTKTLRSHRERKLRSTSPDGDAYSDETISPKHSQASHTSVDDYHTEQTESRDFDDYMLCKSRSDFDDETQPWLYDRSPKSKLSFKQRGSTDTDDSRRRQSSPAAPMLSENERRERISRMKRREEIKLRMSQSVGSSGPPSKSDSAHLLMVGESINAKIKALHKRIAELEDALKDRVAVTDENIQKLVKQTEQAETNFEAIGRELLKIKEEKADLDYIGTEIDTKADLTLLDDKVNNEIFADTCNQINNVIKDIFEKLSLQEDDLKNVLTKMSNDLDNKLDRSEMNSLKNWLESRLKRLNDKIVRPHDLEDEAAGIKKQLLQRVNCISCDRPLEIAPSGPIASIPFQSGMPFVKSPRPYTTFELDQIRQHQKGIPRGILQEMEKQANANRMGPGKRFDLKAFVVHFEDKKSLVNRIKGEELPLDSYDHYATDRQCGGSHTVTTIKRNKQPLGQITGDAGQGVIMMRPQTSDELDIVGTDGRVYHGRQRDGTYAPVDYRVPPLPSLNDTGTAANAGTEARGSFLTQSEADHLPTPPIPA